MKQVGYNFNNYQMNTRNVQKKEAEEKAKETKGETKPESQAPATVNSEPVTANALDVIAKQNMGLQGVIVKPQGFEGAIGPNGDGNGILHLDGYDELVAQFNANVDNLTNEEKLYLLDQIIDRVGNDDEARDFWQTSRYEVRNRYMQEKLHNEGMIHPMTYYTQQFQPDATSMDHCIQSNDVQMQIHGYEAQLSGHELLRDLYSAILSSPELLNYYDEQTVTANLAIEQDIIREITRRINELKGIIVKDDSVAVQIQVNNTPSVD